MDTLNTKYPNMRDPAGNDKAYDEYFQVASYLEISFAENFPTLDLDSKLYRLGYRQRDDQDYLRHQYGVGGNLEDISAMLSKRTARILDDAAFMRANGSTHAKPFSGLKRLSFGYLALAVLLTRGEVSAQLRPLVSTDDNKRSYLFDLLVRAFAPQHPVAKKYKADKFQSPWLDPVVRVLALPSPQRAAAMAKHMQNWTRLMRGFGWKPNLNTEPGNDKLFCDFAFEVALAVCAYDIDDSAFSDHPYYPADLVRYYRTHVRGTRDAWRAEGVGAGVAITAPAPPAKADLAKSKRKGLARWIELVADGDNDATEAVLETTGKVRKVKDLDELLCALSDNSLAAQADIKDDQTLEIQASSLSEARGLGTFDGPSTPPQGPARCEAILLAWRDWTAARGYVQVGIDLQDDAWHAVLVREAYRDELLKLSSELAIPLLPAH